MVRHRRQENSIRNDCEENFNNASNDMVKQRNKTSSALRFVVVLFLLTLVCFIIFVSPINKKYHQQQSNILDSSEVTHTTKPDVTHSSLVECHMKANPLIFTSSDNIIQITLRHDLAPLASSAFLDLVNAKYYDRVFIFRVLTGFIAQWGFRPQWDNSILTPKHRTEISDVVVEGKSLSNIRGTIAFAGGSTVQVFVNLGDNRRLDKEGQRPFGTITMDGMAVADHLYTGHKDGEGQIATIKEGEDAVKVKFPKMAQIEKCGVVQKFTKSKDLRPIREV
mmetsp:Transcript_7498/g.10910  ORF Transcript_7498/g.10910 Transcript_7498/m.10910 type:complete len:279 (-) Transcript_7498:159-995(-)|eukprot:CAMPEP_0194224972 /NCGR_PEP_ID=MMETSP0156-20130528/38562_1 /TAXON_ID=33649 /ORGANISM="Thalassionema nitzschioides, Strain L26-B" /LENGTH=278 /DNA_ID=CAMNT_0038956741 /DNA_START=33 /DNA_END=869 /DNA_ORIENTATION=+